MKNSNLNYLKSISLDIDELVGSDEGRQILNRAKQRLECAIESVSVGEKINSDFEIPSFAVAIMLGGSQTSVLGFYFRK